MPFRGQVTSPHRVLVFFPVVVCSVFEQIYAFLVPSLGNISTPVDLVSITQRGGEDGFGSTVMRGGVSSRTEDVMTVTRGVFLSMNRR